MSVSPRPGGLELYLCAPPWADPTSVRLVAEFPPRTLTTAQVDLHGRGLVLREAAVGEVVILYTCACSILKETQSNITPDPCGHWPLRPHVWSAAVRPCGNRFVACTESSKVPTKGRSLMRHVLTASAGGWSKSYSLPWSWQTMELSLVQAEPSLKVVASTFGAGICQRRHAVAAAAAFRSAMSITAGVLHGTDGWPCYDGHWRCQNHPIRPMFATRIGCATALVALCMRGPLCARLEMLHGMQALRVCPLVHGHWTATVQPYTPRFNLASQTTLIVRLAAVRKAVLMKQIAPRSLRNLVCNAHPDSRCQYARR